jgi:catechol 2,3-dioxygenase-like lactoylglutathione lyase family enzyme
MISIQSPLHVALNVSDLAQAEAFYGGILGLTSVERPLSFPGIWYQVGAFQIHLIVAEGYQRQINNAEKWGRNAHLAFAVEDLEAAKAALVEAGYPVQTSASGRAALFTQDADGNIIELSQLSPA